MVETKQIVRGLTRDGSEVWYTGRAGSGFVAGTKSEAFPYASQVGARRSAMTLNRATLLHGIHFVAQEVAA